MERRVGVFRSELNPASARFQSALALLIGAAFLVRRKRKRANLDPRCGAHALFAPCRYFATSAFLVSCRCVLLAPGRPMVELTSPCVRSAATNSARRVSLVGRPCRFAPSLSVRKFRFLKRLDLLLITYFINSKMIPRSRPCLFLRLS